MRGIRTLIAAAMTTTALVAAVLAIVPARPAGAKTVSVEVGRFVWHDLMTKDVPATRRFYQELFGWRFEDVTRGGRPYLLGKLGGDPVAGIVDINQYPNAGSQWLSYVAVADVDQSVALVTSANGKVLLPPRDLPSVARVAVIADPQGAPLGVAQPLREPPGPDQPTANRFFWNEYLARDATQALDFYRRLAGYQSAVTDTRLGLEYHVLRKTRGHAGLFQLPATATGVEPNWLPYVLVQDPAAYAARVSTLGGRIVLPAATERRNNTLVVIADPSGAILALQKYPF
jgi:predicted enzyme related to lactoylglutathione lyase